MTRQLFQMEEREETAMSCLTRILTLVKRNLLPAGKYQPLMRMRLFPKRTEIEEGQGLFTLTAYFGSDEHPDPAITIEADFFDYFATLSGPPKRFLAKWKSATGDECQFELGESVLRELLYSEKMVLGSY